jgi:hypothetical protein
MKIIGWLLVIGILLSYAPVFPMDECPEGNHRGNMNTDCGIPFHCPMIMGVVFSEISSLPLNGLLLSTRMLLLSDGLIDPVFHPPEYSGPSISPSGMRGKDNSVWDLGTRIADRVLIGIEKFNIFVTNPIL